MGSLFFFKFILIFTYPHVGHEKIPHRAISVQSTTSSWTKTHSHVRTVDFVPHHYSDIALGRDRNEEQWHPTVSLSMYTWACKNYVKTDLKNMSLTSEQADFNCSDAQSLLKDNLNV